MVVPVSKCRMYRVSLLRVVFFVNVRISVEKYKTLLEIWCKLDGNVYLQLGQLIGEFLIILKYAKTC